MAKIVDLKKTTATGRVLILAPLGQDAELAARVLRLAGLQSEGFRQLEPLVKHLDESVGAALIAEEAITPENAETLKAKLAEQEPWSDLPLILMSATKDRVLLGQKVLELLSPSGNVSLLERPFHTITLVTAVQVALRARRRQYLMRDLYREQANSLRQRDEFLSVASHELKTPLTSLKLQIQMRRRFLKRGDQTMLSPEKTLALIDVTEHQVERLARLVDDMLEISRIVNGKLTLNTDQVELGQLVKTTLDQFAPQINEAGIPLKLRISDSVSGQWDRYRIEQVFENLLTNAIKYGKGSPIEVIVKREGGCALLSVQDHGMGIAQENLERVFQRFERAVSGSSITGLGLGLYITRQIVELHGGTISVESELDQGSTFTVRLPAQARQTSLAR